MRIILSARWIAMCYIAAIVFTAFSSKAQSTRPVVVEIRKKDGSVISGRLLQSSTSDSVRVIAYGDTLNLAYKDIRNIDYQDPEKPRNDWDEQPNITRYLLTPTAHTLEEGEVVYQNTFVLVNGMQLGITNKWTIGGGADIFTGSTFYLSTRYNLLQKPKYKFSAGVNFFRLPKDFIETFSGDDIRNIGMVYGAGTWGDTDANFTVGAGYLVMKANALPPILTVSATKRLIRNLALVTENWFFFVGERVDAPVILSGGLRFIGERITFDVAVYSDSKMKGELIAPYFSYARRLDW